jgi:hypothetical protein
MKKIFSLFSKTPDLDQFDPELKRSCLGRLASISTFIFIITCVGVWITGFLLLRDTPAMQSIPPGWLDQVYCLAFFGGLVLAILVSGLGGNMLRRALWRILLRRKQ